MYEFINSCIRGFILQVILSSFLRETCQAFKTWQVYPPYISKKPSSLSSVNTTPIWAFNLILKKMKNMKKQTFYKNYFNLQVVIGRINS